MFARTLVSAASVVRFGAVVRPSGGVDLRRLPPFTMLLVRTMNSLYRVVVTEGQEVYVQGGAFFPDATKAYLEGASSRGGTLRVGSIAVGLKLEIRSADHHVITSRVRAITTVAGSGVPH
jgi:hypothetical protein